jgi:excinuclease ABC subunit C
VTIPREVLVPRLPSSLDVLTQLLTEGRGSAVSIRVPQRGDKRILMETVTRNAQETLIKHKTTRAGDLSTRNRALEEIQEALDLPTVPLRMECYDISNLQGTEVVASMVVFEDGLPRKSEYRRFVIRTIEGQNDVGAMHEVITRRFRRLIDDRSGLVDREPDDGPMLIDPVTGAPRRFAYAPSLVVVDGGPPQVAAAAKAMDELGISDVALCGLAKRLEEVWLPDVDEPVILPRTSEGLYLLQRLRDEAHRFAISHHRSRRSKSMVESLLDQVPGLGEVRRKALITYFGSLKKLRAASVEEIAAVPGFGPKLAILIKDALDAKPQGEAINTATGEILTS